MEDMAEWTGPRTLAQPEKVHFCLVLEGSSLTKSLPLIVP